MSDAIILKAVKELNAKNLPEAGAAIKLLWSKLEESNRMARMAMLKSVESEIHSEIRGFNNLLLYAKRRVTGSGKAKDLMTVAQIGLCIAAACCTGGASAGLTIAGASIAKARDNANPLSGALDVSKIGYTAHKLQKAKSDTDLSTHNRGNKVASESYKLGALAQERFKIMSQRHKKYKERYDVKKISIGKDSYALTEIKRKSTAWKHHGAGGTFAIEHDFAVSVGLAYGEFLGELKSKPNKHIPLIEASEIMQQKQPWAAHLLTRYILHRGCAMYYAKRSKCSYRALMKDKGHHKVGYNGFDAYSIVKATVINLKKQTIINVDNVKAHPDLDLSLDEDTFKKIIDKLDKKTGKSRF